MVDEHGLELTSKTQFCTEQRSEGFAIHGNILNALTHQLVEPLTFVFEHEIVTQKEPQKSF